MSVDQQLYRYSVPSLARASASSQQKIEVDEDNYLGKVYCQDGDSYMYGIDKVVSAEQALGYYESSAACGYAPGMHKLAQWHYTQGTENDYELVKQWTEKAAKAGNIEAISFIGKLYYNGDLVQYGFPVNKRKAYKYFKYAANSSHIESMYQLGYLLERGEGCKKNISEAIHWYENAAQGGHDKAQNNLGSLYYQGSGGVDVDYEVAFKWYQEAADKGNAAALNNLGICYEDGNGVERNIEVAKQYYQDAAEKGNTNGWYNLGYMQLKNEQYELAEVSFGRSVDGGNSEAQFYLGKIYEEGLGATRDLLKAQRYYQRSYEQGGLRAKRALDRVELLISEFDGLPMDALDLLHILQQVRNEKSAAEQQNKDAQNQISALQHQNQQLEQELATLNHAIQQKYHGHQPVSRVAALNQHINSPLAPSKLNSYSSDQSQAPAYDAGQRQNNTNPQTRAQVASNMQSPFSWGNPRPNAFDSPPSKPRSSIKFDKDQIGGHGDVVQKVKVSTSSQYSPQGPGFRDLIVENEQPDKEKAPKQSKALLISSVIHAFQKSRYDYQPSKLEQMEQKQKTWQRVAQVRETKLKEQQSENLNLKRNLLEAGELVKTLGQTAQHLYMRNLDLIEQLQQAGYAVSLDNTAYPSHPIQDATDKRSKNILDNIPQESNYQNVNAVQQYSQNQPQVNNQPIINNQPTALPKFGEQFENPDLNWALAHQQQTHQPGYKFNQGSDISKTIYKSPQSVSRLHPSSSMGNKQPRAPYRQQQYNVYEAQRQKSYSMPHETSNDYGQGYVPCLLGQMQTGRWQQPGSPSSVLSQQTIRNHNNQNNLLNAEQLHCKTYRQVCSDMPYIEQYVKPKAQYPSDQFANTIPQNQASESTSSQETGQTPPNTTSNLHETTQSLFRNPIQNGSASSRAPQQHPIVNKTNQGTPPSRLKFKYQTSLARSNLQESLLKTSDGALLRTMKRRGSDEDAERQLDEQGKARETEQSNSSDTGQNIHYKTDQSNQRETEYEVRGVQGEGEEIQTAGQNESSKQAGDSTADSTYDEAQLDTKVAQYSLDGLNQGGGSQGRRPGSAVYRQRSAIGAVTRDTGNRRASSVRQQRPATDGQITGLQTNDDSDIISQHRPRFGQQDSREYSEFGGVDQRTSQSSIQGPAIPSVSVHARGGVDAECTGKGGLSEQLKAPHSATLIQERVIPGYRQTEDTINDMLQEMVGTCCSSTSQIGSAYAGQPETGQLEGEGSYSTSSTNQKSKTRKISLTPQNLLKYNFERGVQQSGNYNGLGIQQHSGGGNQNQTTPEKKTSQSEIRENSQPKDLEAQNNRVQLGHITHQTDDSDPPITTNFSSFPSFQFSQQQGQDLSLSILQQQSQSIEEDFL